MRADGKDDTRDTGRKDWLEEVVEEATAIYRETGDARAADYHIAFCTLRRRLGREPSEAEVLNELGRM